LINRCSTTGYIARVSHHSSGRAFDSILIRFTHAMSLSFNHLRRPAIFAAIVNNACQSKQGFRMNTHAAVIVFRHQTNFKEYIISTKTSHNSFSPQAT